jgi:hypothetical protein
MTTIQSRLHWPHHESQIQVQEQNLWSSHHEGRKEDSTLRVHYTCCCCDIHMHSFSANMPLITHSKLELLERSLCKNCWLIIPFDQPTFMWLQLTIPKFRLTWQPQIMSDCLVPNRSRSPPPTLYIYEPASIQPNCLRNGWCHTCSW